jgi:hypothetical protein
MRVRNTSFQHLKFNIQNSIPPLFYPCNFINIKFLFGAAAIFAGFFIFCAQPGDFISAERSSSRRSITSTASMINSVFI